jgi:CHAT domain-containing protein
VTWCATGPLAFLPLHAAGEYGQDGGRKVFDFVVSSYTPTLSTLLQKPISLANFCSSSTKILVASQPQTPQLVRLPGSLKEVAKIRHHFEEGQIIHKNDTDATVSAVLQAINDHRPLCIHLACHGVQDANDPTGSAFFLHDGKLELRQLMATSVAGATLAFLSACQTAKGDAKLPEEAVHLAAGMLAVGYRAVIGTLWSIGDEDAPLVADEFYRRMKKDQTDAEGRAHAAYALHGATEVLRKKVGESNFHRWAAFVHFGL